jgi:hypothetical protein
VASIADFGQDSSTNKTAGLDCGIRHTGKFSIEFQLKGRVFMKNCDGIFVG